MFRLKSILVLLIFSAVTFAQDFEVSPVLMSFNAEPGEIQTQKINLINHSARPQKYLLKLSDYDVDKNGNKKPVPLGKSPRSCAQWITLNPSLIELNPNQSGTIEAIITVPKEGYGARWGMITVEPVEEKTAFEADKNLVSGVLIVPRIVILFKQSPKTNRNYKASLTDLKEVTKKGDLFRSFEVTINNTGDNIIDASVHLALANMETAIEEKFNAVKVTVYPDQARVVKLQLPKNTGAGKFALAAIMDYGHRQPLEGTQILLEAK